jgi:phospholipid/cholesterol/gamma-HCH transport system ATP-binding protein
VNAANVIEVDGLTKVFHGAPVLQRLDLEVLRGETLVILGRSGTGKSVLLKHLNALLRPDAGTIHFAGFEVSAMSEAALVPVRRRIGMLFQGSALFDSLTIADNVAFALDEHEICVGAERARRVAELLALVGLAGTESRMPAELSGGMRKRAALARTLALEPEVLLYDEPTTGLDPVTGRQINMLIRDLQARFGLTSIVVTHDLASAYYVADRIAFLADGRIRKISPVDEMSRSEDPEIRAFLTAGALQAGGQP